MQVLAMMKPMPKAAEPEAFGSDRGREAPYWRLELGIGHGSIVQEEN